MTRIDSDGRNHVAHADCIQRVQTSVPDVAPSVSAQNRLEHQSFLNQAPDQCYQDLLAGRGPHAQWGWPKKLGVLFLQNLAK